MGLEPVEVHRRIAEALARSTDPAPAEVAEHWQRGEDAWGGDRLANQGGAGRRAAFRLGSGGGRPCPPVLELWPDDVRRLGSLR